MSAREFCYRVECWSLDGETLLETVAASTDYFVSLAAWQQALRRRPGVLLIHMNGIRVMERMVAPGEAVDEPRAIAAGSTHAGVDTALRDLRKWHRLRVTCQQCDRVARLDVEQLQRKLGGDIMLGTLERRLTCQKCRRRSVQVEVFNIPRD